MSKPLIVECESQLEDLGCEPSDSYYATRRLILQWYAIRMIEKLESHQKGKERLDLYRELQFNMEIGGSWS
jgi:hypothetical protein